MQARRSEVLDKHNLALGVAGSCRYRGGTQLLRTILEAQAASEHAIAGRVLEDIRVTASHHIHVTGNHVRP